MYSTIHSLFVLFYQVVLIRWAWLCPVQWWITLSHQSCVRTWRVRSPGPAVCSVWMRWSYSMSWGRMSSELILYSFCHWLSSAGYWNCPEITSEHYLYMSGALRESSEALVRKARAASSSHASCNTSSVHSECCRNHISVISVCI